MAVTIVKNTRVRVHHVTPNYKKPSRIMNPARPTATGRRIVFKLLDSYSAMDPNQIKEENKRRIITTVDEMCELLQLLLSGKIDLGGTREHGK